MTFACHFNDLYNSFRLTLICYLWHCIFRGVFRCFFHFHSIRPPFIHTLNESELTLTEWTRTNMKINGFLSFTQFKLYVGDRRLVFFLFSSCNYICLVDWKVGISFDFIRIIMIAARNIHPIHSEREEKNAMGHVSSRFQKMMYRPNGNRLKVLLFE